ncbi:membrane protein, partial [Salmonella enterica]
FSVTGSLNNLWLWVISLIAFNFLIFIASVKPRTESQVRQIPDDKIKEFFNNNNIF